MPIVSMNISDSMKRFLKKMVGTKDYKNSSNVMRSALVRLMDEEGGVSGSTSLEHSDFASLLPKITSSVLITLPKLSSKIEKKITRIEINFHNSIIHKSTFVHQGYKTITYILEDAMVNIQSFITEFSAIENLHAFRYIINDSDKK